MKNTFGSDLSLTIFGESHGRAIGAVLDGMAAGLPVDEAFLAACMDKRRARGDGLSTPRVEADTVQLLSGVVNGRTTGTPAAMPSSTAPMALPWLSPKMVSERSLPNVFFIAYSSMPSSGRRPSTGMVSARQQPRPGTLMMVIWPPWAFLSCSISASTFSLS